MGKQRANNEGKGRGRRKKEKEKEEEEGLREMRRINRKIGKSGNQRDGEWR